MYEIRDGHTHDVHGTAPTIGDALRALEERTAGWRRQLAANGEGASHALLLTDVIEIDADGGEQTVLLAGDSYEPVTAITEPAHLSLAARFAH
ncbi:MAG: hypothetical protein JWM93_732 [Frankiales bacterium]|nr:hypothetical protein [Frankiales bacterium]